MMNRIILTSIAVALCLTASNGKSDSWSIWRSPEPPITMFMASQPKNFAITGSDGMVVFSIDMEKREITVPKDVKVDDAARAVIDALQILLGRKCVETP